MDIVSLKKKSLFLSLFFFILKANPVAAQSGLVLNGNFEDINTCTEYNSECGVEGWFYLNNVKIQMLENENPGLLLGSNSFGLFFNWSGYKAFSPIIGTILPCRLQKDMRYRFRGLIKKTQLHPRLLLKPAVVVGENFYVPNRPFSAKMHADTITQISPARNTGGFFQFEFSFVATGEEKFLTFGTFIEEDTTKAKTAFIGTQSISIVLDNFQLFPEGPNETDCPHFIENKEKIYNYNYRHKEMDYSLYAKGDLNILFDENDSNNITRTVIVPEVKPVKTDTLKLSDVLFDFNKAKLKPEALKMLVNYFKPGDTSIDSIYIEGHTDSVGTDKRNIELSRQRCESVNDWLQQNKILPKEHTQIHPFGETRPIAPNTTPKGRALNRRVELVIFRPLSPSLRAK